MKARLVAKQLRAIFHITNQLLAWAAAVGAVTVICASAPAQNLFVTDGSSIYQVDANGVRSTFASGLEGAGSLAFDQAGNLFVGDTPPEIGGAGAGKIYKFTPDGKRTTFATGLNFPILAFDRAGNLFVSDLSIGTIFKFTPDGTRSRFASGFTNLTGLACDRAGVLFASEFGDGVKSGGVGPDGVIWKFTPDGRQSVFAGADKLNAPLALAFDAAGNLFVSDGTVTNSAETKTFPGAIYKFTPDGRRSMFTPVISPFVMTCDAAGNLFAAAEQWNSTSGLGVIYKFAPNGNGTTFVSGVSGPLAFQPRAVTPLPAGPRSFANLSTRLRTELGNDVAIGGFIINGNAAKTVIVRACGPSVAVTGNLADPMLELHDGTGQMIATNDNWTSSRDNIMSSGLAPKNDHEAAIVTTLSPGSYTTVVRGVSNTSGVALVEIFDLSGVTDSKLANISTRGKVETGDDMMIGGFVIGGDQPTRVLVRVIGPSLSGAGIQDALQDSVLQLFNSSGTLIFENDDWRSAQQDQIEASGLAPADDRESAIAATLPPGSYTAVVRGKNDTTGVALVEIYNLETN